MKIVKDPSLLVYVGKERKWIVELTDLNIEAPISCILSQCCKICLRYGREVESAGVSGVVDL